MFYENTAVSNSVSSTNNSVINNSVMIKEQDRGFIYIPKDTEGNMLTEQFKGIIPQEKRIPYEDVGEPLPYNMNIEMLQGVYTSVSFVTGIINKYVDFIISPGFYVKSDDTRAQKIIENFIENVNFDGVLRKWIRDGLICGNGYMELAGDEKDAIKSIKVLNPKSMFAKRDIHGHVLQYTQYFGAGVFVGDGRQQMQTKIKFEPKEIAHFAYDCIGDNVYGLGMIFPALDTINKMLKAQADMHKILGRKANEQLHVAIGDKATGRVPTPEVISAFGQKMQYMNEKTEWVTDCFVDMKVLSFGNVSDKFMGVLENDFDLIFFSFQVPEVLMGRGSIPEGLATVQMEAFMMRIQSIQAELERIIETQIFKRILKSHGIDSHVEMSWGKQSETEKNSRITLLTGLLQNMTLNPKLRQSMESDLSLMLGYTDKIETPEQEKKREMEEPNPRIPGQNKVIPHPLNNSAEEIYQGELVY